MVKQIKRPLVGLSYTQKKWYKIEVKTQEKIFSAVLLIVWQHWGLNSGPRA
jgi:hypothetical protein